MSGGVVSGREAVESVLNDHLRGESSKDCIEGIGWVWACWCDCGWHGGDSEHQAHVADALLASGAVREESAVRAEVLREAADKWQWGEWTVLTAPIKATSDNAQRIIGAAQAVTDWLRDRAALAPQDPA